MSGRGTSDVGEGGEKDKNPRKGPDKSDAMETSSASSRENEPSEWKVPERSSAERRKKLGTPNAAFANLEIDKEGRKKITARASGQGTSQVTVSSSGGAATAGQSSYNDGSVRSKTSLPPPAQLSRAQSHVRGAEATAGSTTAGSTTACSSDVEENVQEEQQPSEEVSHERAQLLLMLNDNFKLATPGIDQKILSPEQRNLSRIINTQVDWRNIEAFLFEEAERLGHMIMDTENQPGKAMPKGTKKADKPKIEVRWLAIGTFTGLVLHFDLRKWAKITWPNGKPTGAPIKDCLPEQLVQLFQKEYVTWHGVGIYKDFQELGVDLGKRWIDSGWLLDTMISRGTLCHYNDDRPKTGMLFIQISMWGRERMTKVFYSKQAYHDAIDDNNFWPPAWEGMQQVPEWRNGRKIYDFKDNLNEHQYFYNTMDILTPWAAAMLKVLSTVEANPRFNGHLTDVLLNLCLEEDRALMPKDYGTGQEGGPNLARNAEWRYQPRFPQLPGQDSPTLRYGRYMGSLKTQMPNRGKDKFGTQAHYDAAVKANQDMLEKLKAGPSGGFLGAQPVPDARSRAVEAKRERARRQDEQFGLQNEDDAANDDEWDPDRWDISHPESRSEEIPFAYDWEIPEAMPPARDEPLREPFFEYIFPPGMEKATRAEKWAYVKEVRKKEQPKVPDARKWSRQEKFTCYSGAPAFDRRCMFCGDEYHSSLDQFFCDKEKAYCVYPGCYGRAQDVRHNIKVCFTLQQGCNACLMRGHHKTECPGTTPEILEETRRLFEEYADQGLNTKRRRQQPYLGYFFFNFNCFKKVDCPWDYEKEMLAMPVVEFRRIVRAYVDDNSGKNAKPDIREKKPKK